MDSFSCCSQDDIDYESGAFYQYVDYDFKKGSSHLFFRRYLDIVGILQFRDHSIDGIAIEKDKKNADAAYIIDWIVNKFEEDTTIVRIVEEVIKV